MEELTKAINRSHDTTVGPYDIHYQFSKICLIHFCLYFLKLFYYIWISENIPLSWKEAKIIPIPKAGKDHNEPNIYCPIALTSCLCKTMEMMIIELVSWYGSWNKK